MLRFIGCIELTSIEKEKLEIPSNYIVFKFPINEDDDSEEEEIELS